MADGLVPGARVRVLPVEEHVADEYGRLWAATEAVGPVADNDNDSQTPPISD
jgi:predicted nucleic acid-binding protein